MNEDTQGEQTSPVLDLKIDDSKLINYIDSFTKNANTFYEEEKHLTQRRETLNRYFFGNQVHDNTYEGVSGTRELKSYEKPYVDNVLKEGEDILRPLVLSRLPDLIVNPGVESQMPRETADALGNAVNKTLHSDELKKILTMAFRHHPLNFTAVIKWRWNSNKGKLGDIDWEVIPPKDVIMDHNSVDNDEEHMKIIVHNVQKSLFDWIVLFPSKEEDLREHARTSSKWDETKDPDGRSYSLKVQEVWFDWMDKVKNFDPEDPKFDFKSGILWKLGKGDKAVILDKRLNPNWDWEGEDKYLFNGQPIPDEILPQIAMLGFDVPGIEKKTMYRNYFGRPRKPFIFMGYEQYGEMPLDETSRIEENLILQENYDTRGMQITKMIDDAKGQNIWSSISGLKKETVEALDPNDPDKDMFIDGNLNEAHAFIPKEQPSNAMFGDLTRTRERMMAKIHISAPSRGEISSDVATTNQIARESDFTVADDISDLTINEMSTKMAEALLHMMKLRYTPEHFQRLIGTKGTEVQQRLNWDVIEDGLEVIIKASGTDKLKAERRAKDEAQLGLIDPVSYYKDTGRSDPENRAEMLFMFQTNPAMYIQKYVKGQSLKQVAGQVNQMNQQNMATFGGQGGQQTTPMQPSPQNTGAMPTLPQGSPRNLIGKATGAIKQLFNR